MGVNASKANMLYDAEASVVLRDAADGAETSTATEAAISLNELNAAYWHGNEIPHGVFEVGIHVSALDTANADETYVLALLVDDVQAMNDTPVVIAQYTITQTGFYKMLVDSKSIPGLDPDVDGGDKWLAIRATLGGTTPSITYGAWLGKVKAAG
jgi:hypothetical protein